MCTLLIGTITGGQQTIKLDLAKTSVIARVTTLKKVVVPPNSVVRIQGKLDVNLKEYYCIEPMDDLGVSVPRIMKKVNKEKR